MEVYCPQFKNRLSNISRIQSKNFLPENKPVEKVFVNISGEIKRPGRYEMEAGSLEIEVIKIAGVKRFSDLSQFDLNRPAFSPIVVPKLKEIHVFVEGEVSHPYDLVVRPGTRICDLKSKICVGKEGDLSVFRSRKMVVDGEKIWVSKKK